MIFALSWESYNLKRPPLRPEKYVTVIPVQSTKRRPSLTMVKAYKKYCIEAV